MSTRSRIGVLNENGSIESVYCHSDGYPEGVGETLTSNYNSEEKAREIISLGDLSFLGDDLTSGNTAAYGRDRGEDDVGSKKSRTEKGFITLTSETGGEYAYLFTAGHWECFKV
jgi:hypothetical protein